MKRQLTRSEKDELSLQKFINIYKYKNYNEIVASTIEIKTSDISSYEHLLLDIVRSGIKNHLSAGMLVSRKIIIERLIENNSPETEYFNELLSEIQVLLER